MNTLCIDWCLARQYPWSEELAAKYEVWSSQRQLGCTLIEYQVLHVLARDVNPGAMLEIGPGSGASSVSMLLGTNGTLTQVTCDLGSGHDLLDLGYMPRVKTVYCRSDVFFATNKKKYEFIFIDGDHTEEGSKRDIFSAMAALTPHGVLVAHDIFSEGSEHIGRHCRESAALYKKQHALIKTDKSGMGVIY